MHLTELPVGRPHEKELVKPSDANIVDNHIAGLATAGINRSQIDREYSADFSAPTRTAGRWDHSDLIRRVLNALDMAIRTIGSLGDVNSANVTAASPSKILFIDEKVVAETAMLLLCVQPISRLDRCIRKRFDAIAALLVPLARKTEVLASICLEPGLAREHAVAHIILS